MTLAPHSFFLYDNPIFDDKHYAKTDSLNTASAPDINSKVDSMILEAFQSLYLAIGNKPCVVYAHNGGSFDYTFMIKHILSDSYQNDFNVDTTILIDAQNTYISIHVTSRAPLTSAPAVIMPHSKVKTTINVEFKDSMRIFDFSLATLCKMFSAPSKLQYKQE